jgi:hypothetical protein
MYAHGYHTAMNTTIVTLCTTHSLSLFSLTSVQVVCSSYRAAGFMRQGQSTQSRDKRGNTAIYHPIIQQAMKNQVITT